jgi:hypothetical protein
MLCAQKKGRGPKTCRGLCFAGWGAVNQEIAAGAACVPAAARMEAPFAGLWFVLGYGAPFAFPSAALGVLARQHRRPLRRGHFSQVLQNRHYTH